MGNKQVNLLAGWPVNRLTGSTDKPDGQSSLELTAALVVVMILLVASVKIFVWLNERIVLRQIEYEKTRVEAGNATPAPVNLIALPDVPPEALKIPGEVMVNESNFEALKLFK